VASTKVFVDDKPKWFDIKKYGVLEKCVDEMYIGKVVYIYCGLRPPARNVGTCPRSNGISLNLRSSFFLT